MSLYPTTHHQLWVDHYRPKFLSEFDQYNHRAVQILTQLAKREQLPNLPHLIIEGIEGIGKNSLAHAFILEAINQFYPDQPAKSKIPGSSRSTIELKINSKPLEITVEKSIYHYNLDPSQYGHHDKHVIQNFLKTQLGYQRIVGLPFKFVIIRNAEQLTLESQQSLRRTLESRIKNCRFIFLRNTQKAGTLIPALYSRLVRIRTEAPTKEQALKVCRYILSQELDPDLTKTNPEHFQLRDQLINMLYRRTHGNLSQMISYLQIAEIQDLFAKLPIKLEQICPINQTIFLLVDHLFQPKPDENLIILIRNKIYVLLEHGIPAEEIIKQVFKIVIANLDSSSKIPLIVEQMVDTEEQTKEAHKPFYHLENLIIKIMIIIQSPEPINPTSDQSIKSSSKPLTTKLPSSNENSVSLKKAVVAPKYARLEGEETSWTRKPTRPPIKKEAVSTVISDRECLDLLEQYQFNGLSAPLTTPPKPQELTRTQPQEQPTTRPQQQPTQAQQQPTQAPKPITQPQQQRQQSIQAKPQMPIIPTSEKKKKIMLKIKK